jgi:hypothetical protein
LGLFSASFVGGMTVIALLYGSLKVIFVLLVASPPEEDQYSYQADSSYVNNGMME